MNAAEADRAIGRTHRHVSAGTRASVVRFVTPDHVRVITACRCGATRPEIRRHAHGRTRGTLVHAGAWTEPEDAA